MSDEERDLRKHLLSKFEEHLVELSIKAEDNPHLPEDFTIGYTTALRVAHQILKSELEKVTLPEEWYRIGLTVDEGEVEVYSHPMSEDEIREKYEELEEAEP